MAIDRPTLLADQVLGHPPDGVNQVADAPFVRGSFVADPAVPPLEYNPVLAKGLVAAATKELGGQPIHLTLEYPAIAEARATVPKIAEAFRAIGVESTRSSSPSPPWKPASGRGGGSTWPTGPRGRPTRSATSARS